MTCEIQNTLRQEKKRAYRITKLSNPNIIISDKEFPILFLDEIYFLFHMRKQHVKDEGKGEKNQSCNSIIFNIIGSKFRMDSFDEKEMAWMIINI